MYLFIIKYKIFTKHLVSNGSDLIILPGISGKLSNSIDYFLILFHFMEPPRDLH